MRKHAHGKSNTFLSATLPLMLCSVVEEGVVFFSFPLIILCWQPKIIDLKQWEPRNKM